MRAGIVIVLACATGIALAKPTKTKCLIIPCDYRGPVIFGKRHSGSDLSKQQRILSALLRYFPQGIPVDWLFQRMKTNPAFARKLTQLLIDGRTDFLSTIDRSNPHRTAGLF